MAQEKKKPLDKMTAKELRDVAKEIPDIVGAHGMNKDELLIEIKKAKGIPIEVSKKKSASIRELKQKIKELKTKFSETEDGTKAGYIKKRIIRLKKMSRRAA